MYDPLLTLSTAAAVTTEIGLGGQVTAAYYPPIWLANALASLDSLSEGRLRVAVGVGWSENEFAAMGSDFHTRGRRTDEILQILRSCWQSEVSSHSGEFYSYPPLKILPPPAHTIPLWPSGWGEAALRRAVKYGDGFHGGSNETADAAMPSFAQRLRQERPDPSTFTISMYTHEWDPAATDSELIRRRLVTYEDAGIQHIVAAMSRRDIDSWLRSAEHLARIVDLSPR
jgi:alkanesulfonate monooxygenase SsuD/methylene tetrahydromethanopterin reductase-like flavin-dependent oxidoreductase (luciferase family)